MRQETGDLRAPSVTGTLTDFTSIGISGVAILTVHATVYRGANWLLSTLADIATIGILDKAMFTVHVTCNLAALYNS